jgi:hypothetical protein
MNELGEVTVFRRTGFLGQRAVLHLAARPLAMRIPARHPERRKSSFGLYPARSGGCGRLPKSLTRPAGPGNSPRKSEPGRILRRSHFDLWLLPDGVRRANPAPLRRDLTGLGILQTRG